MLQLGYYRSYRIWVVWIRYNIIWIVLTSRTWIVFLMFSRDHPNPSEINQINGQVRRGSWFRSSGQTISSNLQFDPSDQFGPDFFFFFFFFFHPFRSQLHSGPQIFTPSVRPHSINLIDQIIIWTLGCPSKTRGVQTDWCPSIQMSPFSPPPFELHPFPFPWLPSPFHSIPFHSISLFLSRSLSIPSSVCASFIHSFIGSGNHSACVK